MTQRIFISPSRVTVSRPGYDAVSPPAFNTDYLAVDSSFPQATRIAVSGVVFNRTITTFSLNPVFFGQTFADFPYVFLDVLEPGGGTSVLRNLYMKWVGGNPDIYSNPYQTEIFKDRFRIGISQVDDGVVRNWIYFVFAP